MKPKQIIEQVKQVYNRIAQPFAQTRSYVWGDLKPFKKYVKNGDKILDLGCGAGRLYQLFDGLQVEYIGVDISEGQIKIAQEQYPHNTYIIAEMGKLPLPDASFDSIFCIAAFHHLPDVDTRIGALEEMKRVLKPGGMVIMTNWNIDSSWWKKKVEQGKYKILGDRDVEVPWKDNSGKVLGERYYHGFTQIELQTLFETVGFHVLNQYITRNAQWGDDKEGGNIISILQAV